MPLNTQTTNIASRLRLLNQVFRNMSSGHRSLSQTGLMLQGDPGIGKTSFISQVAKLLGLELILIEVPHIVEEHLINVPFIVFDAMGSKKKEGKLKVQDDSAYEVVLAKSNLAHQIAQANQLGDSQLLKMIYTDNNLQALHEALGGTVDQLSEPVVELRAQYSCILFIDEYFRKTSINIRNVLRGILNGKIGMDDLPDKAYVVYASNMVDGDGTSLDEVPTNQDFNYVEMKTPTKDEWFSYLIAKFKSDQSVALDMNVINAFHQALENSDISHNDIDADVRTSPRRWEQLLLYVNAAMPVTSKQDAADLLSNVSANFSNYDDGAQSKLYAKVKEVIVKLIASTTPSFAASDETPSTSWRSTLSQQIRIKKKLGNSRSYIPVISGPPGIGKTAQALQVAAENDLRYIYIDCSQLTPDDVIGLPVPKGKGENLGVDFATPKLFMMLDKEIKAADAAYKSGPKPDPDYDNSRWKYLIFLDEMNRVKNVNTFNALRKLLLDKKFNDSLALPESSILIAAINPSDLGVITLTAHMRDVLDILPSSPSWPAFTKILASSLSSNKNKDVTKISIKIINDFSDKFHDKRNSKVSMDEQRFYLNVDGENPLYISPREYTQLTANISSSMTSLFKYNDINTETLENTQFALDMTNECHQLMIESFDSLLLSILHKNKMQAPDFISLVHEWLLSINPIKMMVTRVKETFSFPQLAEDYFTNHSKSMSSNMKIVHYFDTVSPAVFSEEIRKFLSKKFSSLQDIQSHLLDVPAKMKARGKFEVTNLDNNVSLLENFVHDIIHTIKLNKINNEFGETVYLVFKDIIGKLGKFVNKISMAITDDKESMNVLIHATKTISALNNFIKKETV